MCPGRDLTDEQWRGVENLFVELRVRGRPREHATNNSRAILNGILLVLSTGASWASLPDPYPDHGTYRRRFKNWFERGLLRRAARYWYGEAGDAMCDAAQRKMLSPLNGWHY